MSTAISSTVGTVITTERAVRIWDKKRNKSKARSTQVPRLILKFSFLVHWMITILLKTTLMHKHIFIWDIVSDMLLTKFPSLLYSRKWLFRGQFRLGSLTSFPPDTLNYLLLCKDAFQQKHMGLHLP